MIHLNQRETIVSSNAKSARPNAASLIRWSGLAAIAGGLIFAGIQPVHPADYLPSVTTGTWAAFMYAKLAMCLFFLVGVAGIYMRQLNRAGWLGFAGFVLLIVTWFLQAAFIFTEGFILPIAAGVAPQLVESFLTLANGTEPTMNIGAAGAVYGVAGLCYMLGGLLFGIATVRAGVLPRWAAILLAVAAVVTPAAALLPHELQRLAGIPVGLAFAWLGYGVWSLPQSAQVQVAPEVGLSRAAQ
jgi:hypothetical protein